MSLLAPLYLVGALAIGLPILFHLIRRRPQGEVEFSSLMFLRPTPPRLTRRSRLENLPLLLIRALALMLLAAAFARPFLRQTAHSQADGEARRIVIAVDTSASMRRADLWRQTQRIYQEVVNDLQDGDELAVVAFDQEPTTLLGFEQASQQTPNQLKATATKIIRDLTPTWNASDLGRAIAYAAELAVTHEEAVSIAAPEGSGGTGAGTVAGGAANLILITDMQEGSTIESLQVYAWPDSLSLDVRKVSTPLRTNAWAKIMNTAMVTPPGEEDRLRVRVSNSSDAQLSQFRLAWKSADGDFLKETEMPVQVPPGETRVVTVMLPRVPVTSLVLMDDDHDFDNETFLVQNDPVLQKLLYFGGDADLNQQIDPRESLFYYLSRVPLSNRSRHVSVEPILGDWPAKLDPKEIPLITIAAAIQPPQADQLAAYLDAGGRVLVVLANAEQAHEVLASIEQLTGVTTVTAQEAEIDDYVMLSRIKFADPLFAAMADPKFNDFTKIRFWQHRKLNNVPENWNILATYDNGDPALLDVSLEERNKRGKLWLLTTGWQPKSSQLALSTKFIPLVFQWFQPSSAASDRTKSYVVGEPLDFTPSSTTKIVDPDGNQWDLREPDDLKQIDAPGIYRLIDGQDSRPFAVNLAESESRTVPLDDDALERFGVQLGAVATAEERLANGRQLRDIELESRQKLWQWFLVIGLGMLLLESWLGGWMSRSRQAVVD